MATHGGHRLSHPPVMILLLVCVVGGAVWANLWKGDLRLSRVHVEGNQIVAPDEILALAALEKGKKLFDVDLFAAQRRIERNAFIRSASVRRDVPDRIVIEVAERVPLAFLVTDKLYCVDADGMVLPSTRSDKVPDLPVITGCPTGKELVPGKEARVPLVNEALLILSIARYADEELYRRISEVHVEGDQGIVAYTAECGVPILFGRGEAGVKIAKLDAFWNQYVRHHGVGEVVCIDLRFEDQVIVRWNHGKEELQEPNADYRPRNNHNNRYERTSISRRNNYG